MPVLPSGLKVCLDFTELNNILNLVLFSSDANKLIKEINDIQDIYKYINVYALEISVDINAIFYVSLIENSELFDLSLRPIDCGFTLKESDEGTKSWEAEDQICFDIFIDMKKTQDVFSGYMDEIKLLQSDNPFYPNIDKTTNKIYF